MNFDFSRLRRSDRIVGCSAILFFIFLFFFKWLGYSSNAPTIAGVNVSGSVSYSGWHSFTNSRWIWLITIIVALGAVAIAAGALKFESPVQPGVLVAGLGFLSALAILYRIIHHPKFHEDIGAFHASVGIKLGIWLGLIAAAGITYGGYLGMQDEGTSLADVREQASGALSNLSAASSGGSTASSGGASETPAPPIPPPAAPPTPPPAASEPPDTTPA
jgi:hypothetical protein